jgi:SAM-dependent methyltransferase
MTQPQDNFNTWIEALFERWMRALTHQEIVRALRALSRDYVQRRGRLRGAALDGRGKQAAFALYYGPRHFVIVREALKALGVQSQPRTVIDLGCGSGVAGAAWALLSSPPAPLVGVDLNADVLREAQQTWRELGLRGGTIRSPIARYRWPKPPLDIVAAFTLNELDAADREKLWQVLTRQVEGGSRVLILEPLATRITPWWQEWAKRAQALGGRADEWHFEPELPERVMLLGKSAGLNPRELGARTLWLQG